MTTHKSPSTFRISRLFPSRSTWNAMGSITGSLRPALIFVPVILIHLLVAPYTKVEESFNTQAIHDILYHGVPTSNAKQFFDAKYDHVSFPGSVPRTFVGALITAGILRPFANVLDSPFAIQVLARAILGLFNAAAITSFKGAVDKFYGKSAGRWYIYLQASQFHVMYYASRPLPNMFAFGISTIAFRYLMLGYATPERYVAFKKFRLAFYLWCISGVIFRAEIAVLLAANASYLLSGNMAALRGVLIPAGIAGCLIGLLSTVSVDSFFWQRFPLWPELSGFLFNTIEGHSSEWGTSPWWFYFANSLPKLLLNPLVYAVCIPLALFFPSSRQRSLDLLVPSFLFIAVYSVLPHKEWRFIVYVVPPLTAVASAGAAWGWVRRDRTWLYRLLSITLIATTLASFVASGSMLFISSLNYPGGAAIARLHELAPRNTSVIRVHLDNLSCQSGVTRFLQKRTGITNQNGYNLVWIYDKTGDQDTLLDPKFWLQFGYALAERQEKAIGKWEIVDTIDGFAGISIVKPGQQVSGLSCSDSGTYGSICKQGQSLVAFSRKSITRGWWIDLNMEPKIKILKQQEEQL